MTNLKWIVLLVLIAFALGFLTGRQVYKRAPQDSVWSDTTETIDTILTWEYSEPGDTTVAADIIFERDDNVGAIDGATEPAYQDPDKGKKATVEINYPDGEVLDITYSYDTELFDVGRSPAPRPIRTAFITREITLHEPIERAPWDKPSITFGAGCLTGSVITVVVIKIAIGAMQ